MNRLNQYKITECSCEKCISYCKERPGWFRPQEIPPLIKFLDLSLKETFEKYLIADFWISDQDIYLLSPVKNFDELLVSGNHLMKELILSQREHNKFMNRDCDRAGSYASWGYAFIHAPCIFLRNNKCSIYPVRPFECRVTWHVNDNSIKNVRELIAEEWKSSKLLKRIDFP